MCYDNEARPPIPANSQPGAQGQALTLTAADGNQFGAFLAEPGTAPQAQIVIMPDVRGLHQFYADLALRFAGIGVRALALDYFGRTAGLTPRPDEFEYMPHVQQLTSAGIDADLSAALAILRSGEQRELPSFTIGFCMGGALALISGTRDHNLAGVIGFYAGLRRAFGRGAAVLELAPQIKVPVLGLFGGADAGIPQADVEALDQALDQAGVWHEIIVYPGAPHSFFDRRAAEYAEASADAWQRIESFLAAHAAPAHA